MPPLLDAGYRCVAPDLPGFGRSDKPTDLGWYSYDRHVEIAAWMLEQAGVRDATFVVHDWGGPVGMRIAAEHPEMCSRIVVMDTGIFNGRQRMTDAWKAFRDFVERTEDLPVSLLVKGACAIEPDDAVVAAYDAPFPTPASKAGARAFPLMLPTSPDDPGAAAGQAAADGIAAPAAAVALPLGRLRPDHPARDRPRRRRAPQPEPAGDDRERLPLPPGGPGRADRRADRRLARRAALLGVPERKRGGHRGRPVRHTWISDPGYFFFCLHFVLNVAFVGV